MACRDLIGATSAAVAITWDTGALNESAHNPRFPLTRGKLLSRANQTERIGVPSEETAYETARLTVADWHTLTDGTDSLVEIVRELLTTEVTEHLPDPWKGPYSAERAAEWIRDRDAEGTQLLALHSDTREPVALLMMHQEDSAWDGRAQIRLGYLVAQTQWGRGFATELLVGFLGWARASDVTSIVAGVSQSNGASIRVLEKCGLVRAEDEGPDDTEFFYRIAL